MIDVDRPTWVIRGRCWCLEVEKWDSDIMGCCWFAGSGHRRKSGLSLDDLSQNCLFQGRQKRHVLKLKMLGRHVLRARGRNLIVLLGLRHLYGKASKPHLIGMAR